jgi:GNAT superfamily N-acetyltransferase
MMNPREVLREFDLQIRRQPVPDTPLARVERGDHTVRYLVSGWSGVVWSGLDEHNADAVIAAEVQRFAALGRPWEWKYYSYDEPADLPARLRAAGFVSEPDEALLVADIEELALDAAPPAGIEIRTVRDEQDAAALVAVHRAVFEDEADELAAGLLAQLRSEPSTGAGVVAYAGATPIAEARIEFHVGTRFASLWGGATLPAWRGRGVYRSLLAHRAALAAARGIRFLQVDAWDTSRPILERLGFVALATTTPYIHPGGLPSM